MASARHVFDELLTLPREAGTPEASRARNILSGHLSSLGFQVTEQRFRFSPSTLLALPILGAGLGWLSLLEILLLSSAAPPAWGALVVWLAGLGGTLLLCLGVGLGSARISGESREDANLVATRGRPVRRWIVAHYDTKAQGHSMAGRLMAIWLVILASLTMTALGALRWYGSKPLAWATVAAAAGLTLAAGVAAGRGRLRGRSPGARDNGTGLYAALVAAGAVHRPDVGILLTGAEEFGLVGARIFVRDRGASLAQTAIVNLDTLDQSGRVYLVTHDSRGDSLATALARQEDGALAGAVRRRLPLGILVDSVALARSGARAVTLSRLSWSTLRLMHTPGDTPAGLSLETAERLGLAVARWAEREDEA